MAITSAIYIKIPTHNLTYGNNICQVWHNIFHTYLDNNICQGKNQTKNGITSAKKQNYYQYTQIKSLGYTNTDTPLCWKLFRTTFSSDLEEAMTESGESLSNNKIYCSVLEKISKINDVKQNEKHPFRKLVLYWRMYLYQLNRCFLLCRSVKSDQPYIHSSVIASTQ